MCVWVHTSNTCVPCFRFRDNQLSELLECCYAMMGQQYLSIVTQAASAPPSWQQYEASLYCLRAVNMPVKLKILGRDRCVHMYICAAHSRPHLQGAAIETWGAASSLQAHAARPAMPNHVALGRPLLLCGNPLHTFLALSALPLHAPGRTLLLRRGLRMSWLVPLRPARCWMP